MTDTTGETGDGQDNVLPFPKKSKRSRTYANTPRHLLAARRPRSKKHKKIFDLKCHAQVHKMLAEGATLGTVANFIQKEAKELTGTPKTSLVTTLGQYRSCMPAADVIEPLMPEVVADARKRLDDSIDEIAELKKLYDLQMGRIEIDHKIERQVHKLIPTTTNEVRVAVEIVRASAAIKVDAGLMAPPPPQDPAKNPSPKEETLESAIARRTTDVEVAKVLADPKSRLRLAAIAQKFLRLGQSESADLLVQEQADPVQAAKDVTPVLSSHEVIVSDVVEFPVPSPMTLPPILMDGDDELDET